MNKTSKLGMIFDKMADELNITTTMLEKAEKSYNTLGEYLKGYNSEWEIHMYPQGSFELGTVIKPLNEDEQYDVDLVVLVKKPNFDPYTLRENIKKALTSYGRYNGKVEDKKPCIRIQYAESSQFHMDIACARNTESIYNDNTIEIARYDGEDTYYFDVSNPKGYIDWFKRTMKYTQILNERAVYNAHTKVEDLKLSRLRTPLQKAVQILKRHRDMQFADRPNADDRPSSIILTTLCAKAYEETYGLYEKDNVYLTVLNMLEKFPKYIEKNSDGEYVLANPSNTKENFLKKWNDDASLVTAFTAWVSKAKKDLADSPYAFIEDDPKKFRDVLNESFGTTVTTRALESYGKKIGHLAESGEMRYNKENHTVTLSKDKGSSYNKHTYFGG